MRIQAAGGVSRVARTRIERILFDDTTELDLSSLRDGYLTAAKQFGRLGSVLIGSVTYVRVGPSSSARESAVARALKAPARELNCAVVVTAPVSRSLKPRSNKRSLHIDLGNWHELGDESDLLVFLYRDECYNLDTPDVGTAELIVARDQCGLIDAIRLSVNQECGVFSDFAGIPSATLEAKSEERFPLLRRQASAGRSWPEKWPYLDFEIALFIFAALRRQSLQWGLAKQTCGASRYPPSEVPGNIAEVPKGRLAVFFRQPRGHRVQVGAKYSRLPVD